MQIHSKRELEDAIAARCKEQGLLMQCPASGVFNARVAIVCEAPTGRDVEMKMPMTGGTGRVLWDTLRKYNVTRQQVYITNLVKRQLLEITNNDKSRIGHNELQAWGSLLRWELMQLPNVEYVLILGGPVLEALTGNAPITAWRGSVKQFDIKQVMTYNDAMPSNAVRTFTAVIAHNPAVVLRHPREEVVFRMDMHKFHRVLSGKYVEHTVNANFNPSPQEAVEWITKMHDEKLPISFDIETMSHETACIGFANDPHTGYCINFRDYETNRWTTRDELEVRYALQRLFIDNGSLFVAQNASFDCTWLWFKDRIRVHRVWFDTMLAHHTLYSQLPHNLGFLTAQYTDHPYYKDDKQNWREGGDIDQFWRYNCRDVCITLAVQRKLHNELIKFKQDAFFFDHVMRLQPHLVRATVAGMKVDEPLKARISAELDEDVAKLEEQFVELARQAAANPALEVNPRSPKQLGTLLFKTLKLRGKGTSTNAQNRKYMMDHPSTPAAARDMLDALNKYAEENKFASTYANSQIDPDGRIRCEYKQMGVQSAPGRLSSSKTAWDSGMNLQNQPDRAQEMYIADEGMCLVYFDLSQAEARVVAWLADIVLWIEQFEKARIEGGFDCHRALAAEMFSIPYDEVPTADREANGKPSLRFIAKRCRHGLNYRMNWPRLAETTGLDSRTAREAYNLYHRTTPELRVWWDALASEVRQSRQLVSPKGRVLRIMERITDEAMESIVAFKPQSTVGDHVSQVMYMAEEDDDWPIDARMLLNVHDALISLSPIRDAVKCAQVMRRYAEEPIMVNGKPLIIPADFAVSTPDDGGVHRWSTLRKVKHFDQIEPLALGKDAA